MRVVRFLVVAFLFLPFGHFQAQGLSITSSTYLMDGQGVADQSNEEIEVTNDSDQSIAVVIGVEAICMADGDFSGISTCMGTACLPYVFLETFEYPVAENLGPGETMSGFLPVLSEELSEGAIWRFYFYDQDNPADMVYVDVEAGSCAEEDYLQIEEETALNWSFSPNPSSGEVLLESNFNNTPVTILVYDLTGKVVHEESWIGNAQKLDLSHLNKGLYFVGLYRNGQTWSVQRLILE